MQFPGLIQDEWRTAIPAAGLQVVNYIPENAYLVWGDANQLEQLSGSVPLRWTGDYRPAICPPPGAGPRPASLNGAAAASTSVDVNVQVVDNAADRP